MSMTQRFSEIFVNGSARQLAKGFPVPNKNKCTPPNLLRKNGRNQKFRLAMKSESNGGKGSV
jgi:hypothetical protein